MSFMRNWVSAFCVAIAVSCMAPAGAQMPMTGAGLSAPASSAYQGPGDVQSGWKTYWGLNAFTAATRGQKVIRVCDNSGVNCDDMFSDATTGMLVPKTLVGGAACPGTNCRVTKVYDQSGAIGCIVIGSSTAVPCDLLQATAVNMPKLLANQFGTNPGIVCVAANSNSMETTANNFTSTSQPGSLVATIQSTTTTTNNTFLSIDGGSGDTGVYGQNRSTAKWRFIGADGSFISVDSSATFTANIPYVFVGITASGVGNSSISVNGTTTTATMTGALSGTTSGIVVCNDAFNQFFDGSFSSLGITSNAANISAITSNLRTIWGF